MLHGPADDRFVAEVVGPAMGAFVGGAPERALEIFMRAIGGDHARPVLEAALGDGAWDRAREESAFFFADELRAVREWQFGPDDAARISQPALIILGSGTPALMPNIVESVERLASALPNAVTEVLDGVDHMMPLEAPRALGEGIASFARRHPVAVPNRRGAA